jgi:hypothetical protein
MMYLFRLAMTMLLVCQAVSSQGTLPNLEAIFRGRCLEYNITKAASLLSSSKVNCDDLWGNFSRSWTFKDPHGNSSYADVVSLLDQTLPKDKALFWSGTNDFAHTLSNNGRRYVTLEDTLIGYAGNDLVWCGQTTAPGINYTDCPRTLVNNFWPDTSKWFASHANGEVQVVLNGSNPGRPAYRVGSVFRGVEVVNMRSDLVTKVTAFVVHDLDTPRVEPCGTLSLLELAADLQAKNIAFECIDNPPEVKHLLCVDSPSSTECNPSSIICEDNSSGFINADGGIKRQIAMLLAMATFLFVKVASN